MTSALLDLVRPRPAAALSGSMQTVAEPAQRSVADPAVRANRGFTTPHAVVHRDGTLRLLQFHRDSPGGLGRAAPGLLGAREPALHPRSPSFPECRRPDAFGRVRHLADRLGSRHPGGPEQEAVGSRQKPEHRGPGSSAARCDMPQLHLMGYCLGGTLATILTAIEPATVKSLILMAAPIDLARDASLLKAWADERAFDVDSLIDAYGNCPGSLLRSCFAMIEARQELLRQVRRAGGTNARRGVCRELRGARGLGERPGHGCGRGVP